MDDLKLKAGDMGWCPQANGAVVGPLKQAPFGFLSFGNNLWVPEGLAIKGYDEFGPITAIAVPLPPDAPVGSRWQCVMGGSEGDVICKLANGALMIETSYYFPPFFPTDLFIRLPDAASKETAMTHFTELTAIDCPPAVPDFIPWDAVHRDFNCHARDADGQRHFYEIRPDIGETRWKLQGNKIVSSAATAGIIIGDKPWDQSLECRPRLAHCNR